MVLVSDIAAFRRAVYFKIKDGRWEDVRRGRTSDVTVDEVCEMVENHDGLCSICSCEMVFEGYAAWCLYQFTLDRIDNSRGHDHDNLRLSCFACNSFRGRAEKITCLRGCHAGRSRNFLTC